jgi:hypothetical protein
VIASATHATSDIIVVDRCDRPPARLHSSVGRAVPRLSATVTTMWQAEGVLMELLGVDAAGALLWLESIAAQRGDRLDQLAAAVVERRTI